MRIQSIDENTKAAGTILAIAAGLTKAEEGLQWEKYLSEMNGS